MPRPKKKSAAEIAAELKYLQQQEDRIYSALGWTEGEYKPDVPPPESSYGKELSTGYMYNVYYGTVEVACSSSTAHSIGQTDHTTSQGSRHLFSTRELALRSLRQKMEREFAEKLAKIDIQIEGE